MIRNNLAILMAKKGIKNNFLAAKTGISKNTISATASNEGKMIQLETINKICHVLQVTPCEFFSYLPFDIEVVVMPENIIFDDVTIVEETLPFVHPAIKSLDFDIYLTKISPNNSEDFSLLGSLKKPIDLYGTTPASFLIKPYEESSEELGALWTSIPVEFKADVEKQIKKAIIDSVGVFIQESISDDDLSFINNVSYFMDTYLTESDIEIGI